MPQLLRERTEAEKQLASSLATLGGEWRAKINAAAGSPPDVSRIPGKLWHDMELAYQEKLAQAAMGVYLLSLGGMVEETPDSYEVDKTRSVQMAGDWSRRRAGLTAEGFAANTRAGLSDWAGRGGTPAAGGGRDTFSAVLDSMFGGTRIDVVSATETTAAISGGEAGYRREYLDFTGDLLLASWNTEQDGLVCPACGPLDGVPQTDWPEEVLMLDSFGPPLHPNCRCWLTYTLVSRESLGV